MLWMEVVANLTCIDFDFLALAWPTKTRHPTHYDGTFNGLSHLAKRNWHAGVSFPTDAPG